LLHFICCLAWTRRLQSILTAIAAYLFM